MCIRDSPSTAIIGIKEIKEVIKVKSILKDIFRETFIQLIINHDFNPAFPAFDYRTPCNCPGAGPGGITIMDCGEPAQNASQPTGTYPQTLTLTYLKDDCTPAILQPSGKVVSGDIDITFSAAFSDPSGHSITIVPKDNFEIEGHSVSSAGITISSDPSNNFPGGGPGGLDFSQYSIDNINMLTVTSPTGATTIIDGAGPLTSAGLGVVDVGSDHGMINNAFGFLNDFFILDIPESDALTVHCSNGQSVMQHTSQPLIYDMNCPCVQGGKVIMKDEITGVTLFTYHYDSDGSGPLGNFPGTCDDKILVQTHCLTLHDPNSATTRDSYETIDCL